MKNIQYLIYLLLVSPIVSAQEVLQGYINIGLSNNLALQQKEANYRQSLEALREAKGLFYPNVSLNARYTVSEGGRIIEFPVGDLLNGVYSTLNQLTASDRFPVLENQEFYFFRPTEHETKIRFVQPVFNSDIHYNARIKKELAASEQISLEQYKRELIAEIKKAYYNTAMAHGILVMLTHTRSIVVENVRVNTKLAENDKVTRDVVLRSETELYQFDQQLQNARKNNRIATAYFNFLLNRPLTDSVIIEDPQEWNDFAGETSDYITRAVENREEIKNFEQYIRISDLDISRNRGGGLPDLTIVADYGFQGEKYEFNKNQDYIQASAVLSWDLFAGLQNRSRIKQSIIRKDLVEKQLEEAKNRIALQVLSAIEEIETAEAGLAAAQMQVKTAREVFRLVNRKYEEGQANLIEFIDARNTMTRAEENLIISKYTCLQKYADFENVIVANNQ